MSPLFAAIKGLTLLPHCFLRSYGIDYKHTPIGGGFNVHLALFVYKKGWNCPHNGKYLSIGPPNWPKMAKIIPKWPPKDSPNYCLFMASATILNLGLFRPFWARKRAKISPKIASITYYWTFKWAQFCPKQPKNDSQMTPTVHYSYGQYYCTLFEVIWVIFGWRKEWNQH